jgi:hypothetical protein
MEGRSWDRIVRLAQKVIKGECSEEGVYELVHLVLAIDKQMRSTEQQADRSPPRGGPKSRARPGRKVPNKN